MMEKTRIYFAPLQGYTEDAYRRLHHELCGGVQAYVTPFVRLIHGQLRPKDMRDIRAEHNQGVPTLPQIMPGNAQELHTLVDAVVSEGYGSISINMGCPFPLQTRHGHGAGLLADAASVRQICDAMQQYPQVQFSVKMRLGMDSSDDWRTILPILNDIPLQHITLHPRIAAQQYTGQVDMQAFADFAAECRHPLIYNGDLHTPQDVQDIADRFPHLHGVMVGRGLLARPTLAQEYLTGESLTLPQQQQALRTLHDRLLAHYQRIIPGDAAQLNKIRSFWFYTEPTIGHKPWKKLKKAGSLRNYLSAVQEI